MLSKYQQRWDGHLGQVEVVKHRTELIPWMNDQFSQRNTEPIHVHDISISTGSKRCCQYMLWSRLKRIERHQSYFSLKMTWYSDFAWTIASLMREPFWTHIRTLHGRVYWLFCWGHDILYHECQWGVLASRGCLSWSREKHFCNRSRTIRTQSNTVWCEKDTREFPTPNGYHIIIC